MRLRSALLAVAVAASPAAAVDLIELKSGRVLEVRSASIQGDRLRVELSTRPDQFIATTIPIDQVIPEFVFYVWAAQLPADDVEGRVALAQWARENGLFRQALRVYEALAASDPARQAKMPALLEELKEEEATWHFHAAERFLKEDEVHSARIEAETVLAQFADSKEVGRATELLKIIQEREQFLSEQKLKAEAVRVLKKQTREVDKQMYEVARGDRFADGVMLRNVQDARYRLRWAGHLYRRAGVALSDLLPYVEDEGLRKTIEAHLDRIAGRVVHTYARLADVRYLVGDIGGALDATYQVLDVDPENKHATAMRDRILDGPDVAVGYVGGWRGWGYGFCGVPYYGFGTFLRARCQGYAYPTPYVFYGGNSFYRGIDPAYRGQVGVGYGVGLVGQAQGYPYPTPYAFYGGNSFYRGADPGSRFAYPSGIWYR